MYAFLYKDMILTPHVLDYSVTIGLLAVLLGLIWKYWTVTQPYADFPTGHVVLKLFAALFRKDANRIPISAAFFQTYVSICERFQKEGICVIWCFRPLVIVTGEESAKIFSNESAALDKSYHYESLQDAFGTGLVTSNGETWKKHRKMLMPVFHVEMLKNKMAIFNENSEKLVKKLGESVNETSINVLKYIKPCTMSILLQFAMGLRIDDNENKSLITRAIQVVDKLSPIIALRFCIPLLHWKFMLNFIPSGRQYIRMYDAIPGLVKKFIENMRKTVISRKLAVGDTEILESEEQVNKSFSHILFDLHMKDPSFTLYDLESEVVTFIAAGYDTVAHAMMWTLYLLGLDPAVQDRVYDELEIIGDGPVLYEDAQQLKYMECVIKESLRLFPPVPVHARRTAKDIQCGKYKVPSGSDIVFFPYVLHRDPDVYPHPEKFDPERFAEGNFKKPWIHTPFSEGIRNCIGKRFAMLELKVMLAHVLRNFRVTSLDSREDLVLCWECVLIPSKPLRIQFSLRN